MPVLDSSISSNLLVSTRVIMSLTMFKKYTVIAEDTKTLVIDCGFWMFKIGIAGDDKPQAVFPSVIGPQDFITFGMNRYYMEDG
jgi:hypothetical protein